jgi:hypothetical protein
MDSTRTLVDLAAISSAMWLMVRAGTHYKLLARRPIRRCAACGRLLKTGCRCNSTR